MQSVKTAEDAKAFAKEHGLELTNEQAAEIASNLVRWESGELSDEELAAVSGGIIWILPWLGIFLSQVLNLGISIGFSYL